MYFVISLFPITYGKVEVHPATCHKDPQQKYRYNSYSFFNFSTRWGVGGQHHALAASPPGQ